MNRNSLRVMRLQKNEAANAYDRALAESWPIGTMVEFTIREGQINPSKGEVRGHSEGQVVIKMDRAGYRKDYTMKRIPASQMVTEPKT